MVQRNHERPALPGFNKNAMIAFLAVKAKSILLKYADEALMVNRPNGGHAIT